MAAAPVRYALPDGDLAAYLRGAWSRSLEWRQFGPTFDHLRTSNSVVVVEDDPDAAVEPGTQALRWSFGRELERESLQHGFSMIVVPDADGERAHLEWTYKGCACSGHFVRRAAVAVLQFPLEASCYTITYRIIDADSMAVCIVEVDDSASQTIQFGHLLRLDPEQYPVGSVGPSAGGSAGGERRPRADSTSESMLTPV